MPEPKIAVTLQLDRATIGQLETSDGPDWPRMIESMITRMAPVMAKTVKTKEQAKAQQRPGTARIRIPAA